MPLQARLSLSRSTWANQFNTLLYAQLWYNEGYFGKDILLFKDKKAMPEFKVEAPFQPTGDQPEAIEQLAEGIANGAKMQTLLGERGAGKPIQLPKLSNVYRNRRWYLPRIRRSRRNFSANTRNSFLITR